ncbi:rhomboid family intramembrane serine protease isoform B [Chlorella sorokiniana]|uniref:Rhomboid family intramembrane serine protease isoform B n=1 Tax=Chlorella sorokiniana TaxID=3076 RepID=A0A2P6TKT7_CHLSO|nr:rhomboid family intramembrane serine protease isoform B [Chlorella sorokiniana]|eukprot:PRW44901.1 rhomboid family intramembrane serine protease isoform B [Chlorella sorokiniana]
MIASVSQRSLPSGNYSFPACARRLGGPSREAICRAEQQKGRTRDGVAGNQLESLDALLGTPPPAPPPADSAEAPDAEQEQKQGEGWYWWERPAGKQTNPLRKKGMEPGSGGAYLDSERLTRDPLQLAVGERTAMGEELSLPESRPVVSLVLAAVALAAGAAYLDDLPTPQLAMDTVSVAVGARWQLFTAALQPYSAFNTLATVAALLYGGQTAEKRLGSGLFAASFFLSGATSAILWYGVSSVALAVFGVQEGSAVYAGAGAGLLGSAAALGLAFLPANWAVLSPKQRASCATAAVALAAVCLTQFDLVPTVTPLDEALGPWINASSALVGLLLGWLAGPQLQAQRELNIAEGSMTISGDEEEVMVVVDRRTGIQRWVACGAVALALWGLLALADELVTAGVLVDFIVSYGDLDLASPEVQADLYEAAPEAWKRNA